MKKLRWQLIIIFMTGLVVGILLLGEQPGTITPAAPEPAKGGTYTEALIGSLQRLNPVLDYYNSVDRDVNKLIFSGLVRYDARGIPQPDLAENWGIAKDGTVYNFALRKDVKWQDGEPLTSDDVLFTIDMIRNGGTVVPEDLQNFWKDVDVVSLSENTLQFRLPEPFAPFLDYLTFGILPKHILNGLNFDEMVNDPFNMEPVGSGPYKFDHLIVEDGQITGVVLKAFDGYYRTQPYIDEFVFRYYPDSASALQAYDEGAVQGISQVTQDILPDVLKEPNLSVYSGRKPELTMVLFNLKDPQVPFFGDKDIRRALLMGINRRWIVDRIMGGQAIIANGPILPGTWAYYDGIKDIPFDTDNARSILKDAGYVIPAEGGAIRQKDDVALKFEMIYPDDDVHAAIAEQIKNDWANLEVEVDLVPMPYDQIINEKLANRDYQAALVDLNLSRSPDPDPYPFWDQAQATGGQNYSQWDDRVASEYLEQARVASTDMAERERLYRNFQVVFNEKLPALPLYYPVYTYAVDRQVQGIQMGPLFDSSDRFATVFNWFMIAKRPVQITPTSESNP